jgi:hypothetical protein
MGRSRGESAFFRPDRRAGAMAVLAALVLAFFAAPGRAGSEDARDAALCERAIVNGARTVGVPVEVLHAISLTETGRQLGTGFKPWPWAVNREGQGHWFDNREQVLAFARESLAANRRSFDLGCFQINYNWHGHNFPSVEAMVDPETSAVYAARFLQDLHRELGTWSAAAGAYHSRTPEFASRYRERFDRILAGLGGAPLVTADGFVPATAPPPDAAPAPVPQAPVRQVRGPKIIAIARAADAPAVRSPAPAEARRQGSRRPGVLVVTVEEAVTPLVAGRRL